MATPLPVVGREFGLILCFRSFSFQDQLSNVQDMQLEWALRTFRLKNAGGNAERISYHPSPTSKLHIISVKLQLTGKSSLTYQFSIRISLRFLRR